MDLRGDLDKSLESFALELLVGVLFAEEWGDLANYL